jgi:hypothetical protein
MKQLEARLGAEGYRAEAGAVGNIAERLSGAQNIQEELERLMRTEGMEQLAMGLMWLASQEMAPLNGLLEEMVEYQVNTLRKILLADPDDEPEESQTVSGEINVPGPLNRALIAFSRHVADLKRRLTGGGRFQGFSEELAWRMLDQIGELRQAALMKQNSDVPRFCDALAEFLDYVVRNKIFTDIRVLGMIDSANRTLQTVVAGEIPEEQQSLEQTIELLRHPSIFFGK